MWKTQRNWEDLANAIVLQAIKDYRNSRRRTRSKKYRRQAQARIREVEQFIGSWWFYQLTDIDGDKLKETLRREPIWKYRIT